MEYIKIKFLIKIFLYMEIILLTNCLPQEFDQNYLGIEPPKFFSQDPSPLQNRNTLRTSPAYFDFLNTLYRNDKTKADLFQEAPLFSTSSSTSSSSSSSPASPSSSLSLPSIGLPPSFRVLSSSSPSSSLSPDYYNNHQNPIYNRYQQNTNTNLNNNNNPFETPVLYNRNKRAIIFRPLFVYRQQQIRRQRVRTNRI